MLKEIIKGLKDQKLTRKDFLEIPLKPFQVKGVQWMTIMLQLIKGVLLADEMGLGKTLQVIAALNFLLQKQLEKTGKRDFVVILTQANVQNVWVEEFKKAAPWFKLSIFTGNDYKLRNDVDILLITNQKLLSYFKIINTFNIDYLVIDEAQKIKNRTAHISILIKKLKSRKIIAITGTPIENDISDLYSILEALGIFKYKEMADNLKILLLMLRRPKKQVVPELQLKIHKYIACEPTEFQLRHIDHIATKLARKNNNTLTLDAISIKQLSLCNSHPYLVKDKKKITLDGKSIADARITDTGKMSKTFEIISDIIKLGEKAIIITDSIPTMEQLRFFCKQFDIPVQTYQGSHSIKQRKNIIKDFQQSLQREVEDFEKKKDVKVLILSLTCGGTGITLTNANHVILFNSWWNDPVLDQASDRTHRIGQKKQVIVYHLFTKYTAKNYSHDGIDLPDYIKQGRNVDYAGYRLNQIKAEVATHLYQDHAKIQKKVFETLDNFISKYDIDCYISPDEEEVRRNHNTKGQKQTNFINDNNLDLARKELFYYFNNLRLKTFLSSTNDDVIFEENQDAFNIQNTPGALEAEQVFKSKYQSKLITQTLDDKKKSKKTYKKPKKQQYYNSVSRLIQDYRKKCHVTKQ